MRRILKWFKGSEEAPYLPFFAEFLLVLFAALLRFFSYGFSYYPMLDDYVQYFNYASSTDYAALIAQEGFLASRPLAGIGDLFFWSHFRGNLAFALLLLSVLWALSAVLFRRVLSRYFPCGWIFLAAYTLLPLNFEGTYWLSASTRIVCGMFFLSLALTLFERVMRLPLLPLRGTLRILAFAVTLCLAYCFYEQILVLSLTVILLFSLLGLIEKNKKALWGLLSFGAAAGYFAFTGAHYAGNLTSRMEIILPTGGYYFNTFLPFLLTQLRRVFLSGNFFTVFGGVRRGAEAIVGDGLVLPAIAGVLAAGLWFFAEKNTCRPTEAEPSLRHPTALGFLFAALTAIAPVTPFFIINNPWFSFRNAVPSLLGAALLCDLTVHALLSLILRHHETARRIVRGVIAACLCALFCVASVSELHDYRAACLRDRKAAEAVLTYLDDIDGALAGRRLGILNLNAANHEEQNYFFHEHICSTCENTGMFCNLLVALGADAASVPEVVPLDTVGTNTNRDAGTDIEGHTLYYLVWNASVKRLDGFDALLWYDEGTGTLVEVTAQKQGDTWTVTDDNGILYARITETDDGTAWIETA